MHHSICGSFPRDAQSHSLQPHISIRTTVSSCPQWPSIQTYNKECSLVGQSAQTSQACSSPQPTASVGPSLSNTFQLIDSIPNYITRHPRASAPSDMEMPPPNTPEDRLYTPYVSHVDRHAFSSSPPWTPPYVPPPQQQEVPPQQPGRTLTIVPSSTLIRRRPLQPPQSPRTELPQQSKVSHGVQVDLRNLDYISIVDENLICPICRTALINPITTSCDHVFCRDCFDQSHQISATCPIDRWPIILPQDMGPTHRLILNQLDGLEVKCPNYIHGCEKVLARSMVQNHFDKYCGYAIVDCPEKTCDGKVLRKDISGGCLHYTSICPDCTESLMQVDMKQHRDKECLERKTSCEKCCADVIRCRLSEHDNICEEAVVPCKWKVYGCFHTCRRKDLIDHAPDCEMKIMGPVVEALKDEIGTLQSEIQFLNEKDKAKDRRLKFLESDRMASASSNAMTYPVPDMSALPDTTHSSAEYAPFDSRDQYILSLLESQESKVDQLSVGMSEIEAKQTMMLFNETIPIKEQLAEIRSAQGVLSMHVRWLMNFRLQERRPGATAGPSNETHPGSGPGGPEFPSMRRPSDTMRELVTKL